MTKTASVYIEVEEHFDDDVDDDAFAEYDEVDNIGEFAELVWQKRLEELGFDGRVENIDCYKVDD